jgi:hypothetical protein
VAALCWLCATSSPLQAAEPLSVAGPGFATSFVLGQFAAQAAALAGQAAADGALEASRAAREAELLAANARAELRENAATPWDKLPAPQQALLKELDGALADARRARGAPGQIDAPAVLDLAPRLTRLAWSSNTPVLRRVVGANVHSQLRDSHQVRLSTNLAALGASGYALSLAGQPVPASWLQPAAPDELLLNIPASAMTALFSDRSLVHVPIELSAVLPSPSWKFWQSGTYQATLPFSLALFPRQVFRYALKETVSANVVDASRELVAPGRPLSVPGCGAVGCEQVHNVCNSAPEGAKPIQPVFFSDSASADFDGRWVGEPTPGPNGFCVLYRQRSPGQARVVNFDVRYHPALPARQVSEKKLRAAAAGANGAPAAEIDALELARDYVADLAPQTQSWALTLTAFNGQTYAADSTAGAGSALLRVQAAAVDTPAGASRLKLQVQLPW